MNATTLLPLILFMIAFGTGCERENYDILIEESEEEIVATETNYTPDHVRFNANGYINTAAAYGSECDLYDPVNGDFVTTAYLVTNLDDLGNHEPEPAAEGDFYLLFDQLDHSFHHANVMVRVADTLTLACPITMDIDLEPVTPDVLAGTFSAEFYIVDNEMTFVESIGVLSGDFHVPLVPCQ